MSLSDLLEDLSEFLKHHQECGGIPQFDVPCDCGLDSALEALVKRLEQA